MTLPFRSETQEARFHSPLEDFEEVGIEVEVREDPLTGRQSRIVPENFPMPADDPDISSVVEDDEGCFFCPGTVEEATPTYGDWFGADRGSWGEATSFPNLNPYGGYSNVVALTEDHYRPIDEFTPDVFEDGLNAALEYVRAAMDHDESARLGSVNMNFLRPAGSSLVHPHVQTLVDDRGTNEQRRLLAGSREYHEDHDRSYWADLLEHEAGGERHVGTTGDVEWIAPFAPKHHRHLLGVAPGVGVPDPGSDVVGDLARGITSVLSYYGAAGHDSFNFALSLADDRAMPPVIELTARAVFEEFYWSDSPFFTVLHGEGVVDEPPEAYAGDAADHF
jgi:galactose-1-phosphate uridylyltransferase